MLFVSWFLGKQILYILCFSGLVVGGKTQYYQYPDFYMDSNSSFFSIPSGTAIH